MGMFEILFGKRKGADPVGFNNTAASSSDSTDFEDASEKRDPRFDGWRLWISYADFDGSKSERWVRVFRIVSRQFNEYLIGHCELRDSIRTFRIDRIIEVADRDGEIHEPHEFFRPYLPAIEGRSSGPDRKRGFGKALHIIDQIGDDLKILAFVSEADGRMGNKEAEVIIRYASLRSNDLGLDINKADTVDLRRWLKLQNPDAATLKSSIARVAKRKTLTFEGLWELCSIVVEVDGKIHDSEIIAMSEVKNAIEEEYDLAAREP
jgi:uncharacterized tellurite resistance protein B-like protein